ncbi:ATP synthase F1 subunit delta [Candidatus Falkowbacteria bacterium CG10_big_fil_rev_8_21_14_0_10_39_9]|uniref:ATP synthase subunit delta n=1 Tax=Candidatus Falkowbacteria bacterium CG10_big_fil_rev_8_21_14_0_10_39_9 TaxID=1974566 RepID=A0A2M6WPI9_9BACT|nr:MAG: ATP synthase F1 subunit delta [Candidatus Falkowbacteria bacterium CG10_big_fil_rev_8_21_14_0_10_39_9]
MKISDRQYAESLLLAVSSQSESEGRSSLDNFAIIMRENLDLNRLDAILAIFSKLWDKSQGELAVEFTGARAISTDVRSELEKYLQTRTGAKKIVLTEKVDTTILGGFVLRYEDRVLDASLKQNLVDLKNSMNK